MLTLHLSNSKTLNYILVLNKKLKTHNKDIEINTLVF